MAGDIQHLHYKYLNPHFQNGIMTLNKIINIGNVCSDFDNLFGKVGQYVEDIDAPGLRSRRFWGRELMEDR